MQKAARPSHVVVSEGEHKEFIYLKIHDISESQVSFQQ